MDTELYTALVLEFRARENDFCSGIDAGLSTEFLLTQIGIMNAIQRVLRVAGMPRLNECEQPTCDRCRYVLSREAQEPD